MAYDHFVSENSPLAIVIDPFFRHERMMDRAYLSIAASEVSALSNYELYGQLAAKLPFAVEPTQRAAWQYQIEHLRQLSVALPIAHFFVEFLIPRMGRRADLVIVKSGIIFVVEYKLGALQFDRTAQEQVYGYGLDLKHFHETSHKLPIVPILVATHASEARKPSLHWDDDQLAKPICVGPDRLAAAITSISAEIDCIDVDPQKWAAGRYRPTPTIIEAAQALYRGHAVEEISRSEAGAQNLAQTSDYVAAAIETAKTEGRKVICFITGVPGSGKTLAGLNLATARQRSHEDEHAVFLSGNGPLVEVLREALALDAIAKVKEAGLSGSKATEDRRAAAFIQNIHHFRDEALSSDLPPIEKVVVFDEAQRAWDVQQTSKFMQQKRGQIGFTKSEPEFLLGVMDRHPDWCAIVCLVGGGQEINTGEAGIEEWLRALQRSFPHWQVHLPSTLGHDCSIEEEVRAPALHLATSIRSFRAERLSDFVGEILAGNAETASEIEMQLENYPLLITRDLHAARAWLRTRSRGQERSGLLASSNGLRLKPHGIFVKSKIEPAKWFLALSEDIRSSDALEDAGTEFDVQGLELDWSCVCWDGNLRRGRDDWDFFRFKGNRWEAVKGEAQRAFITNAYRVLLTRARQGLVVFVPEGSDEDLTRPRGVYDDVFAYLVRCGFRRLPLR
ncbi:DNA/RNA helicase domain-containing protein [Sphingopyxis sp. MSC1_008]|uniref:DNA/RNA helicase domain-containing protein n=1 Tax=Sphingopyxis sp. MSC1_008 TaxID=2909265 RepID=UPI0020C00A82